MGKDEKDLGRLPDGTGLSQAEPEVSALRASIPSADQHDPMERQIDGLLLGFYAKGLDHLDEYRAAFLALHYRHGGQHA